MLEPMRALWDLQSSSYGAMSHVIGVLVREIRADGAIGLCRDMIGERHTVFVCQQLDVLQPKSTHDLRMWPTDPQLGFWHGSDDIGGNSVRLLDISSPTDAAWLREIAEAMALPELCEPSRCLVITLDGSPVCRMLFVRLRTKPAFTDEDTQHAKRYVSQCCHIIRSGHERDSHATSRKSTSLIRQETPRPHCDPMESLSATERLVLQRLRLQETEREAAEALGRSPNTIHVHVKSIYRKLRVTKRSELLSMLDSCEHDHSRTVA